MATSTPSSSPPRLGSGEMPPPPTDLPLGTVDDLDRLESRLERFVHLGNSSQPSTRKNSAGSHIPKPEISPKPTFLISACKGAGAAVSQSLLRSPPKSKSTSTATTDSTTSNNQDSKTLGAKASGTASMLKSTLKRMTRLSINTKDKSRATEDDSSSSSSAGSVQRAKSMREPATGDPLKMTRSLVQVAAPSVQRNSALTSSLRRQPRSKDDLTKQQGLQRSGTGGTLERRSGVSRSQSVTGRKFRDRDLNVKKSRACQTQLTRDVLADEDGDAGDGSNNDHLATNLEFNVYLPELLGAEVDPVETHVSEPTEPVDVRKNRWLTLDNMKLHREVERLKSQVSENDALKKELRGVRSKLEEEQKSRMRIEQQLDKHNEKVRMIVQSMDCVEKEFENRDENILSLEKKLDEYKNIVAKLQFELDASGDMVVSLQSEVEKSLAAQKVLLNQYQEAEAESRELQEFLQAEKMTLAETLKDYEVEISTLNSKLLQRDKDLVTAEERCCHLVRLGEQRHQEAMALQAQLNSGQERTKDMLLAQGAEISRANIHVSELYSRLEKLIGEGPATSSSFSAVNSDSFPASSSLDDATTTSDSISTVDDAFPPAFANFPRSNSQFLVPTSSSSSDLYGSADNNSNADLHMSESLQNLSKAISQRQKSENGMESLASSIGSLPSLVDRINDVQMLIDRYLQKQNRLITNGHSDVHSDASSKKSIMRHENEEKENVSSNEINKCAVEEQLKCKEKEMSEMKTKFLKHRQILVANYEQAESEIRRLDDIYHDTVESVLEALASIPDVVATRSNLQQLKKNLEISFSDGKGIKNDISVVLKADNNMNANQSL